MKALKRREKLIKTENNIKAFLKCVAGYKAREELRRTNETLCWECEKARERHRLMKETIEKLAKDYEASKEVDVLRRYKLLKSMIKWSVTQVRLRSDDAVGQTLSTGTQRQQMKRKEEQVNCKLVTSRAS